MKDMNIAKLTADDLPLFNGITGDLFPGIVLLPIDYGDFISVIRDELLQNFLQVNTNIWLIMVVFFIEITVF